MSTPAASTKHGDFTGLAGDYARYRPGYAPSVLAAITGLLGRSPAMLDAVDVGAGTGIWTQFLVGAGFRSVTAVEPNDDMRRAGIAGSNGVAITWRAGSGEQTGLDGGSADLLTMASSFHWTDFERATAEFHRVLRPGGWFVALWNPRLIETNPLLVEIEDELKRLKPEMARVSSGRAGLTDVLTDKLWASPHFDDVIYLEGRHHARQTPAQYLGAWRSVNDVRVQLGPERFAQFLVFVENRTRGLDHIATDYLTRAWAARRRD